MIKRYIPNAVSLANFFQEKLPTLFQYIAEEIKPPTFNHSMTLQEFIKDIPIHNEILQKSVKLIFAPTNTPSRYPNLIKHRKGNHMSYYFNRSDTIVHKDKNNNDAINVDASRVKNYRLLHYGNADTVKQMFSLEQLQMINTLHEVQEVYISDDSVIPPTEQDANILSQSTMTTRNQGVTTTQQAIIDQNKVMIVL